MIVLGIVKARGIAAVLAAAGALAAIAPAHANSSASADISAPLRAAQAARAENGEAGDEQFRKLFNSWQSLEHGHVPALASVGEAAEAARVNLSASARVTSASIDGADGIAPPRAAIPSRTPLAGYRLTSEFGMREHPILGGMREHEGVDLAAPVGTPVYAAADGIVGRAEWNGGYGLFVSLEHGGNMETRYGHMSRLNVAAGQRVHKGDVIGFVGATGRATGPHLHYEVRIGANAVNPLPYMQSDGGTVGRALVATK